MNSDDEDTYMSEDQNRALALAKRKAKADSRGLPDPSRLERVGEQSQSSTQMTTRSISKSTTGNDGDQRVSKELVPVKKASRAGGLRSAVGSGSTGTCVAQGHPPKT
jgi:hypothetical protein